MKPFLKAAKENFREKTDGFKTRLVLLYSLMYATWPPMWFTGILVAAEVTKLPFILEVLTFTAIFSCMWTIYNGSRKEIVWVRDLKPMLDQQIEVAKMGLDKSSELEPDYDAELMEAAKQLADNLRNEGLEVWSQDGNVVVAEDGCYGVFRYGESPEFAEHITAME